MIEIIRENIMLVIAALGTGNLVVAAASIVKAFSQRTLNKTFDAMTNGAKGLLDTNVFKG